MPEAGIKGRNKSIQYTDIVRFTYLSLPLIPASVTGPHIDDLEQDCSNSIANALRERAQGNKKYIRTGVP